MPLVGLRLRGILFSGVDEFVDVGTGVKKSGKIDARGTGARWGFKIFTEARGRQFSVVSKHLAIPLP